jgi:MraZ protein
VPSEWEKVVAKFGGKKVGDGATQLFELYYVGGAQEVQVDKQGRILIPPKLREYARLTREVTFNSKHNRIQLWDTPTLDKILKSAEELLQDPEFMAKIDIEF